jgi:hypothetical protein
VNITERAICSEAAKLEAFSEAFKKARLIDGQTI